MREGVLDGARPEIATSWLRCRDLHRVHPALRRAPLGPGEELVRRRERDETFAAAGQLLGRFSALVAEKAHVLGFVDADGVVLEVDGDVRTLAAVGELNFRPGASWREDAVGTNGPGTALVEGRAIEVVASEHLVEAWHPWRSAGAPILAPGSGEPAGAIALLGAWDAAEPQGLVVAAAIAAAIEERLRARRASRDPGRRPPAAVGRAPSGILQRQRLTTRYAFDEILGGSLRLRAAVHLAEIAARNDLPTVLHGESGTGKELFAHGIHGAGARAQAPFVAVNCGAIPAALIESELFGYEAGTFTGGQREGKAGKLEEAHGGTLFLDEVSELPQQAQTALLRVLQEGEVVRLGGSAPRRVDVRVVAATNRRLSDEVGAGRFRQDLFFRLNVLHIDIPPLRDRPEDVPALARAFLTEAEERIGRSGLALSEPALALLAAHPWPGNVRELKNVMMRAAAVATGDVLEPAHLKLSQLHRGGAPAPPPSEDRRDVAAAAAPSPTRIRPPSEPGGRDEASGGEAEGPGRDELVTALEACGWNIARTATTLGVSRMTLYRRLRKFGITR